MRYVKLKIPVKTYVRRYLEYCYPGTPKITITNKLGILVYLCLERQDSPLYKKTPKNLSAIRYALLTDSFTVLLPANNDTYYRTGFSIPPINQYLINDWFESQIIRELHVMANVYQQVNLSVNQAIEHFCFEHDIILDIDITHAALKKAEYRFRKKQRTMAMESANEPL